MPRTDALFARYYFDAPGFVNGTAEFHDVCRESFPAGGRLLEIGAGPANLTSAFLAGLGTLVGVDVSAEIGGNHALSGGAVFDGKMLPFGDACFDGCVSNHVLEHVADPAAHLREVARVLRPGGRYVFRTPNLHHYVGAASWLLPHAAHIVLAKWSRAQTRDDHDPWVTHYRANTRDAIERLAGATGLEMERLRLVEKEPSYGRASPILFYPMMVYERLVNSTERLAGLRSSIVAVLRRPATASGAARL
jgi:SAM-dependent methyltransferase